MMLLRSQGCCPQMHGIGKTYVFPCFYSGDGLCQALHPTLPCLPWNWQHSFVSKTAGAGSQASNQLSEMWRSMPRGIHSLDSCTEGLGGWPDFPSPPRGGVEEPEMNTMLETAGPNFLQLFIFSCSPSTPSQAKTKKIIIGLWVVSNCVLHPPILQRKKMGSRKNKDIAQSLTTDQQLIIFAWRSVFSST